MRRPAPRPWGRVAVGLAHGVYGTPSVGLRMPKGMGLARVLVELGSTARGRLQRRPSGRARARPSVMPRVRLEEA